MPSFDGWSACAAALKTSLPKSYGRPLRHLWRLSGIVSAKYACVRVAMILAALAVVAFFFAVICGS